MPTLTIPAADFVRCVQSVIGCASTDITTPVLCAVHISWGDLDVKFEATNRYVAAEQTYPTRDDARAPDAVVIPTGALKRALAVIKATAPETVTIDPDMPTVAGLAFVVPGNFPQLEKLWTTGRADIGTVLIDPNLISLVAGPKIKGKLPTLQFTFTGETKPVLVARQGDDTYRAILMPCRPAAS